MDVEALARALRAAGLGGSERTAHRYLMTWLGRQDTDRRIPRVTLHRSGGRGRPSYRVDPVSFVRWLRGASRAAIAA